MRRIPVLSAIMALSLVVSLIPIGALPKVQSSVALAEDTVTTAKAFNLGTSQITGAQESSVYFGTNSGSAIKWRVLAASGGNSGVGGTASFSDGTSAVTADDAMFLMSDALLGTVKFDADAQSDGTNASNTYQESNAQAWCTSFLGSAFSSTESAAILETTKTDTAYTANTWSSYQNKQYNISFTEQANILAGDKVFFLSAEEANSTSYGFVGNASATETKRQLSGSTISNAIWWLRSQHTGDTSHVSCVFWDGCIIDTGVECTWNVAPAFNLNTNAVLFSTAADASAETTFGTPADYTSTEWKFTLADGNDFSAGASTTSTTTLAENYTSATVTVSHAALSSFADAGYTNVTAVLLDESGNVLSYGSVNSDTSATSSEITIPTGLAEGSYTLHLYAEDWNGANATNYASGTPYEVALNVVSSSYTWTFQQNWLGYDAISGSYPTCNYYIYRYVDTSKLNTTGVSAVGGTGGYTRMSTTNFSMSTLGTATSTYTLDRYVPNSYLADGVTSLEYTYVLCEFSIDASGTWATAANLTKSDGESVALTRLTADSNSGSLTLLEESGTSLPALYLDGSYNPVTSTASGATLATRAFVLSESGTVTVTNASGYLAEKNWSDGTSAHASGEVTLNIYKVESVSEATIADNSGNGRSTTADAVIYSLNNVLSSGTYNQPSYKSEILSLLNVAGSSTTTLSTVTLNAGSNWQATLGDLSPTTDTVSYTTGQYYGGIVGTSGYSSCNYTVSATTTTTYYIEEVSQIGYTTSYAQGTTTLTPTTITYLDGSSSTTVNAAPVASADSAGSTITITNTVDTNTSDSTITITNKLVDGNGNAITNDDVAFSFSISSIDPLDDTTRENSQVWGFRYIDADGDLHDVLNGGDKEYTGISFAFANVTIPAGKSITIISLLLDVDGDGLYDATCEMGSYYIYELTGEYMPTKAGYSYAGKSVEQTLYPDDPYSAPEYETFSVNSTLASGDKQTITFTNTRTKLEEATIEIVKYLDGALVGNSTDYTFTLYEGSYDEWTGDTTYTQVDSTSSIENGHATINVQFDSDTTPTYYLAETGYPSGMASPDTTVWEVQLAASDYDDEGNALDEPEVYITYTPSDSVTLDALQGVSGTSVILSEASEVEGSMSLRAGTGGGTTSGFDKASFSNATSADRYLTVGKQVSVGGDGSEIFDFSVSFNDSGFNTIDNPTLTVESVTGSPAYYTLDYSTYEYTLAGTLTAGSTITLTDNSGSYTLGDLLRMKAGESVTFKLTGGLASGDMYYSVSELGADYDETKGYYDSNWYIESLKVNGASYYSGGNAASQYSGSFNTSTNQTLTFTNAEIQPTSLTIVKSLVDEDGDVIGDDDSSFSFSLSLNPLDTTITDICGIRYTDSEGTEHDLTTSAGSNNGLAYVYTTITIPAGESITITGLLRDTDGDGIADSTCYIGSYEVSEDSTMPTKAGYTYSRTNVEVEPANSGSEVTAGSGTYSASGNLTSGEAHTVTFTNTREEATDKTATIEIVKYLNGQLVENSSEHRFVLKKRVKNYDAATNTYSYSYKTVGSTSKIQDGSAAIDISFSSDGTALFYLAETVYPSTTTNPDTTVWEVYATYNSETDKVSVICVPSSVTLDEFLNRSTTAASAGDDAVTAPESGYAQAAFSNATSTDRYLTVGKKVSFGGDGTESFDFGLSLSAQDTAIENATLTVTSVSGSPTYYTYDTSTGAYTLVGTLSAGATITLNADESSGTSVFNSLVLRMKADESVTFKFTGGLASAANLEYTVYELGCCADTSNLTAPSYNSTWTLDDL